MKRTSVRPNLRHNTFPKRFLSFLCALSSANLCLCHQLTFQLMMRTERGSCTLPQPAPCRELQHYLQNKVKTCQLHNHFSDICRQTLLSILCCHADRWPSSPLSRSPAPDRRILTSSVPASPTNPMRRLILSPSPLTQSRCTVKVIPAVKNHHARLQISMLKRFGLNVFLLLFPSALNEELKMKLEKRRVSQDWLFHKGMTHSHSVIFVPILCLDWSLQKRSPLPGTREETGQSFIGWLGCWTIWTGSWGHDWPMNTGVASQNLDYHPQKCFCYYIKLFTKSCNCQNELG